MPESPPLVSLEPAQDDPFATPMTQPMAQPGEMPHAIMPEQERELGGGGSYEPIPLLGGGAPERGAAVPEPANDWRFGGKPPPIGHNQPPPDLAPGEADRISTRVPTSAKLDFDPHETSDLQVGHESSKAAPQAYERNADIIRNYRATGLQDPENLTADQVSEGFIEHMKNNLLALHDYMPQDMRDAAKGWYEGANSIANRWAQDYGLEPRQVAGVIAAQSPQKDWNQNVSLAKRVLDISRDQASTAITDGMNRWASDYMAHPDTSEKGAALMQDFLDRNQGVPLSQMTKANDRAHFIRIFDEAHNDRDYPLLAPDGSETGPALNADGGTAKVGWGSIRDIAKAVSVLQDGAVPNISEQMGEAHKVRNFYNNIISPLAPHGDVTIDTHAIAAANLYPLTGEDAMTAEGLGQKGSANNLTGSKGLYGLYAEAYRRAAAALGMQPRQLQSVVWEGARSLFPADKKALMSYRANIEQVWQGYHDGLLTLPEAQRKLFEAAGGIRPPDWAGGAQGAAGEGRNPAGYAAPTHPADQGQLPGRDLHGPPAGPAGSGGGGAAPSAVPAPGLGLEPADGDPFAGR
jgi:hypothetical protein